MPCCRASMVTALMTPLMPGAGPPPTRMANRFRRGPFAMEIPLRKGRRAVGSGPSAQG